MSAGTLAELLKTHVVTARRTMSLAEAADLLDLYQVPSVPVLDDDGALCGMLSESDLVCALRSNGASGQPRAAAPEIGAERVEEWMSTPPIFVAEGTELSAVLELMRERQVKRVPVVSAAGSILGILNRIDVIQAIFEGLAVDCPA